jgi:hypothetical protein
MYFFDFYDYCYQRVIGSNSENIFITPVGGVWSDMESTYRYSVGALLKSVGQWYDMSNAETITYQYNPSVNLSWPSNTNDYNLYSGPWTFTGSYGDDGHTLNPIVLDTVFEMNNVPSSNLYIGSNGYITLGSGDSSRLTVPSVGPPATICGNPGDNWLNAGAQSNSDGDIQNAWYRTGADGSGKYYVKILVYSGTYNAITTPTSWIGNLYRDSQYQWFESRAKSNLRGNAGPFNATSVAQPSSTTSRVWRGDLNGQNWVYMGTGSVTTTRTCPECETYYTQFTATTLSISSFWDDADNNFVNTTQADFTTYVQNMYHQQCLLKQLLKCVDGDTFPTFTNLTFNNY